MKLNERFEFIFLLLHNVHYERPLFIYVQCMHKQSIHVSICYLNTLNVGQTMKEVLVKMEKQMITKPFLGGYRSKLTGVEYHHASVQAIPNRNTYKGVRLTMHTCTVALKKKFTYRTVLRTYHATQRTNEKAPYASGKYTNYARA